MTSTPRQRPQSPTHNLGDATIPVGPQSLTPNGSRMPIHTFNSPTRSSLSRHNSNPINSPIRSKFGVQKAQTRHSAKQGRPLQNGRQAPVAPDTAYQGSLDGPDLNHPNPFGVRSRVIGGERYPVMKGKQPFAIEKYASPTSLSPIKKTLSQINGSPLRQPKSILSTSPAKTPVLRKPQLPSDPQALRAVVRPQETQRESLAIIDVRPTDRGQLPSQETHIDGPESEVDLPITPSKRRGILSPRTQQRKLETLMSGGKSRAKRKVPDSPSASPRRARKDRPLLPTPALTDEDMEYHELLSSQILALQAEIAELDDEIEVLRKQAEHKSLDRPNTLDDYISELLQQNDRSLAYSIQSVDVSAVLECPKVPSYNSVEVPDQLAQLQRFCSLTFNDLKVELLPMAASAVEKRRYSFNGSSSQGLLYFKIEMLVRSEEYPVVEDLKVVISPWARPELASFLHNTIKDRNINTCLYAINSYASLVKVRSENLARLHIKYPNLLHPIQGSRRHSFNQSDREEEASDAVVKRRELTTYMSQQRVKFKRKSKDGERDLPDLQLLLTWSIKLDSVGIASSDVHADALMPSTWIDRGGNVHKRSDNVSEVLKTLIKDKGVFKGICTLVDSLYQPAT